MLAVSSPGLHRPRAAQHPSHVRSPPIRGPSHCPAAAPFAVDGVEPDRPTSFPTLINVLSDSKRIEWAGYINFVITLLCLSCRSIREYLKIVCRVMEWVGECDLGEFAPALRGSGVHGGLLVLEPRCNADLLANLLNIPESRVGHWNQSHS